MIVEIPLEEDRRVRAIELVISFLNIDEPSLHHIEFLDICKDFEKFMEDGSIPKKEKE